MSQTTDLDASFGFLGPSEKAGAVCVCFKEREKDPETETDSRGELDECGPQGALNVGLLSGMPRLGALRTTIWNLLAYFPLSRGLSSMTRMEVP